MAAGERLLVGGGLVFAAGVALVVVFDSWWAVTVQIVGGAIAVCGSWLA